MRDEGRTDHAVERRERPDPGHLGRVRRPRGRGGAGSARLAPVPGLDTRLVDVDGAPVLVSTLGSSPGSRPPVVLLHGVAGSSAYWLPTARRLARSRRTVLPDLPGFGGSPPLSPGFRLPEVRDRMLRLLDVLALERVDLVGHSLGGSVAIAMALAAPGRISSLALVAPIGITRMRGRPGWIHPSLGWPGRALGPLAARLAVRPRVARALISTAVRAPREVEPWLQRALIVDAVRARRSSAAGFDSIRRRLALADLDSSRIPVLAIWGERDTVTEAQRPVFEHALPRAGSVVVASSGHAPMLDRPGEVLELLTAFLDA